MANGNTEDRRAKALADLRAALSPHDIGMLRRNCERWATFPALATQRKRAAVARAAQVILDAGVEGLPPTLASLLIDYERDTPEEEKGPDFVYVLKSMAEHRPSPFDLAISRHCPDQRARFAFAAAEWCEFWHRRQLSPRLVLAAAIAWGVEPPPPPSREHALIRAWEGRVTKARKLAKTTWDRFCSFPAEA